MTNCPLCDLVADTENKAVLRTETLVLTTCITDGQPLFISTRHCTEFPAHHKAQIVTIAYGLWPGKGIRWTMAEIHDHAHAHVETGG